MTRIHVGLDVCEFGCFGGGDGVPFLGVVDVESFDLFLSGSDEVW